MHLYQAIVFSFVVFTVFLSCNSNTNSPPIEEIPDANYANPSYEFPSSNIVEPSDGYPHPVKQYPYSSNPSRSLKEYKNFCENIKKRFYSSNATINEAEHFLDILNQKLTITDGPYGMPSPDYNYSKGVDIKDRVLVKKISDSKWEIFYYYIGCGKNYTYSEVTIHESEISINYIERWSESYPC